MTGVFEPREPLSAYCVADAAIRLLAAHQDNKIPLSPLFLIFGFTGEDRVPCSARDKTPHYDRVRN